MVKKSLNFVKFLLVLSEKAYVVYIKIILEKTAILGSSGV